MDSSVALVQAYLRLNGYFTVTEHPVIGIASDGQYRAATDLDVLAFRFPEAGRIISGGRRGRNEEHTVVDDALGIQSDQADMLIGEVKEGRAVVNAALGKPDVLHAALVTFGCCSRADAPGVAVKLVRDGHADLASGHRIRTAIFASQVQDADTSRHLVVSLGHVAAYVRSYIDEHWEILRPAESKDPAFGFLMMLEKAERGNR
jgi:hypothetical protein